MFPISIIYSPFANDILITRKKAEICSKCKSFINKFCSIDQATNVFLCGFCQNYNKFSGEILSIEELESTSIEYVDTVRNHGEVIVFVIDIASESLEELKSTLLQIIAILPSDAYISIITFSNHVYVYNLKLDYTQRIALRGNKDFTTKNLLDLLRIEASKSYNEIQYFNKTSEFSVIATLESLEADLFKIPGQRKERCTGTALKVAIELLRIYCHNLSTRIFLFVAGAATVGNGSIVGLSLTENIRTFHDIKQKKNISFSNQAKSFYDSLSLAAFTSGQCINIISGSIDQAGLYEMEPLCQTTGGYLLLYDSYANATLRATLLSYFKDIQKKYSLCTLSIHCSANIKICGAINLGYSHLNSSPYSTTLSIGLCNTNA